MENGRLLIYTCCNKKYEMFIPLFILSHLIHNDNIDIEIGVSSKKLNSDIEKAISIIRDNYKDSEILISYDSFIEEDGYAIFDGKKMLFNTVRFIRQPLIKDEYTYITDIDVICCESILKTHLDDMSRFNSDYSNIIRKDSNRMTGLHFTKTDIYWPLPDLCGINLIDNDEIILNKIVSKRNNINKNRKFRPVHGIHMSLNRPYVGGNGVLLGWGADKWREQWVQLAQSKIYNIIYNYFNKDLKVLIQKLEAYYGRG